MKLKLQPGTYARMRNQPPGEQMLNHTVRNLTMTAIAIVSATVLTALGATGASAAATAATRPGHADMAAETVVQPVPAEHVNPLGTRSRPALEIDPLAGVVRPASDACADDSIRDDGQAEGGGGYFLTDEGHNNPVRTTGTGSCWGFASEPNGSYLIGDVNADLCLNVASGVVYADSCISGDEYEEWYAVPETDGAVVFQNVYYSLNLTAVSLTNGSEVVVAGGPASTRNYWWVTLV